jgi:hypothetical protein
MVTQRREQRATRKLHSEQRAWIKEAEVERASKSEIPVRVVPKGYLAQLAQERNPLLQLQHTPFMEAGDWIREASSKGQKAFREGRASKEKMIDNGNWPLMSKGGYDRETYLGRVKGDYDLSASHASKIGRK